eukprot:4732484-Lingulodinium_polyedra.AAC.1
MLGLAPALRPAVSPVGGQARGAGASQQSLCVCASRRRAAPGQFGTVQGGAGLQLPDRVAGHIDDGHAK